MAIEDFQEKEIRAKILTKVAPSSINKNGKHWKGTITYKGKVIGKVKIPNHHKRIMREKKSKHIAEALNLSHEDFNALINCPLKQQGYYKKMNRFL